MGNKKKKRAGKMKKRVVCVTHTNGTTRRKVGRVGGRKRSEGNGGKIEQLTVTIVYRTGFRKGGG